MTDVDPLTPRSPTAEPRPAAPGLRDRAASGVLWSVAQRWAARIGGLLTVVVLARLLTPDDFGVVAVAMAFIPVVYLLSDFGFSTYVVQVEDASPRVISTAFWYAMFAGGLLTGLLVLAAPLIAASFRLPALTPVILGMAPSVLLVAASSVPIALLRRRMAFRALATQSFIAAAAGQVVAIALALTGFGVWALVAQLVLNQLLVAILAWTFSRFRPMRTFSWHHFREMASFGISVIGVELIATARLWAETAIVTAVLGVGKLGYLNIAQRLVQATQDLSGAAIVPVSTVVFAQIKLTPERLAEAYRRALETMYAVIFPVLIGVAVGAPLLIPLLFGEQWSESIVPAQALSLAGILTLGAMLDYGLFYGLGRPGRWLVYAVGVDALTVGATALAAPFGLSAVAFAFVGVAAVATAARWVFVSRLLGISVWASAKPFLLASLASLPAAAAGIGVLMFAATWPPVVTLAVMGVAIAAIHILLVRLLLPAAFADVSAIVRRRLRRGAVTGADGSRQPGGRAGDDADGDGVPATSRQEDMRAS
jgi:O-antigen/teichoic acid export membrane protein